MDYNGDTPEDVAANAAYTKLRAEEGGPFKPEQVEMIASEYFGGGWAAAMAFQLDTLPEGCTPTDAQVLRKANHALAAKVQHWQGNHDNMVMRCALLSQREDLPVDRIPAYKELVRLQDEILALHRQLATETLRADQGWQRYESANADRNALRTERAAAQSECKWPNCMAEKEQKDLADQIYRELYSGEPEPEPLVFGKRGEKMTFTVGVQTFTLDYEPETDEEFKFMSAMLTKAIARVK